MMAITEGQNWRPYLESFEKVTILDINKTELGSFQVNLEVAMKSASAQEPIPYFGYVNGGKIREIATGP